MRATLEEPMNDWPPRRGVETSHGQGTLYIITGKYDRYKDVGGKFLGARFESKVPTVFEYLRRAYDVPAHQTLIVNGEDRPDEEFYAFSNHFAYGINYRSNMLSLYRFKAWLMRQQVAEGKLSDKQIEQRKKELAKWEKVDYRTKGDDRQGPKLEAFWQRWRATVACGTCCIGRLIISFGSIRNCG